MAFPSAHARACQVEVHSFSHGLRPILYVEFAQNLLDVVLYGQVADVEDLSDLVVAFAVFHPCQDFDLACGQDLLGRQRGQSQW